MGGGGRWVVGMGGGVGGRVGHVNMCVCSMLLSI